MNLPPPGFTCQPGFFELHLWCLGTPARQEVCAPDSNCPGAPALLRKLQGLPDQQPFRENHL